MGRTFKLICTLILLFGRLSFLTAQEDPYIDSLKKVLVGTKDTTRLFVLSNLVDNMVNPEEWSVYNKEIGKVAAELFRSEDPVIKKIAAKAIGDYFNNLAFLDQYHFENDKALQNYTKSLQVKRLINDSAGISVTLCNVGQIYADKGNIELGLEYMYSALTIAEKIKYQESILNSLNNIGNTYYHQDDFNKALEFYRRSYALCVGMDAPQELSGVYNNMAASFEKLHNYDSSLYYYTKCLKLTREMNNYYGLVFIYDNMGSVYIHQKKYAEALVMLDSSLKYVRISGADEMETVVNHNYAEVYLETKQYKKALEYATIEKKLAEALQSPQLIRNAAHMNYQINKALGNNKEALADHELYMLMKDSLDSEGTKKAFLKNQFKYDYEKKEVLLRAEQDKRNAVNEEEKKEQRIIIAAISCGLVLVIILALVIFKSLRENKKKNKIITAQKQEVEQQKLIVEQQKQIVEEHQKEILDSIHYAKRIQRALLPTEKYITRHIKK